MARTVMRVAAALRWCFCWATAVGTARAFQCSSDTALGPAARASQKGIAVDDSTLRWCSAQIPRVWPNAPQAMTSIRLFKAWDPLWEAADMEAAWANLLDYATSTGAKVFVGTPITCSKEDDEQAWGWTKRLLQKLRPEHVMGLAIGNELELLQFKDAAMVPAGCLGRLWEEGYLWRQFVRFVREFDELGFAAVPVTSVFTGLALAGQPFYEVPGKARVGTFMVNATKAFSRRFAFVFNFYPYFDPNMRLNAGPNVECDKALRAASCWGAGCVVPAQMRAARLKMRQLTGTAEGTLWVGETGWSSPLAGSLVTEMKRCPAWSSLETFRNFYEGFLEWDFDIGGGLRGPDHVFWFTMRDAINFGEGEHFGLIESCDEPKCKVHSKGYEPVDYRLEKEGSTYCGDDALYNGWAQGEQNCRDKCTLDSRCAYYGVWPLSFGNQHWCRLTATCKVQHSAAFQISTYKKVAALTTSRPSTAAPTSQTTTATLSLTSSTTASGTTTRTSTTVSSTTMLPSTAKPSTTRILTSSKASEPPATTVLSTTTQPTAPATSVPVASTSLTTPLATTTQPPTSRQPTTSVPLTQAPTTQPQTTLRRTTPLPPSTQAPTAQPSTTLLLTSSRPPMLSPTMQPAGACEFDLEPPFPGFFWDPSCAVGMLGCKADGKNAECRFCGGGVYSNVSCPPSSCKFANEPFVPYYWDASCEMGELGCWADGVHAQCRFCGRRPYTSIACPKAAVGGRSVACLFDEEPTTPYFWDPACAKGTRGCLADGLHLGCRFCGRGDYTDIPCPSSPSSCAFANEPTVPYYWEPRCVPGMLGCLADGIHAECRFCAQRPFESVACPGAVAPPAGRCTFPVASEPRIPYFWDASCRMGMLGCWADGIHAQCRFCGSDVYRDVACPTSGASGKQLPALGGETQLGPGFLHSSLPPPADVPAQDALAPQRRSTGVRAIQYKSQLAKDTVPTRKPDEVALSTAMQASTGLAALVCVLVGAAQGLA